MTTRAGGPARADTTRDVLTARAREWDVTLARTMETPTSLLGFGVQGKQRVVLKVLRAPGDEWHGGAVAAAFHGHGTVRVYEHVPGAALLEHLDPGTPLVDLVLAGRDDEATDILAHVIRDMLQISPDTRGSATAAHWGAAFDSYAASGDVQIPSDLVRDARDRYAELCRTQRRPRLLHGDLQHYNVLLDHTRGWVAIDAKGVVAEVEYELGAALRNPHGMPELYSAEATRRRIGRVAREVDIDVSRVQSWAFAQAVLSAIWGVEDHGVAELDSPALRLALALRPLVS